MSRLATERRGSIGVLDLKPTITQSENVIEPIENHFVVRDADDCSILVTGVAGHP